jgi:competence ComEA-like helix-hairpin-helix protein
MKRLVVLAMAAMSVWCVACMDPMPLYAELGPTRRAEAPVVRSSEVVGEGALAQAAPKAAPAERGASRPAQGDEEDEGPKDGRQGVVNVNTASEEELMRLPGVGPKMAERIMEARARRPFVKAAQLRKVKGIGPKKWAKLAPYVRVEGETTLVE